MKKKDLSRITLNNLIKPRTLLILGQNIQNGTHQRGLIIMAKDCVV